MKRKFLNEKIVCEPELNGQQYVIGSNADNGNVIIKSNKNSELLYLDCASPGGSPIYIGMTKSRGTQEKKLPVGANDFIGGIQAYARVKEGSSIGYNYDETPLSAAIQFKVADDYVEGSSIVPTELLIALTNNEDMAIKVIIDSTGKITTVGTIQTGNLEITDQEVLANPIPSTFVKAIYNGKEYAIPLYSIQETFS